jgi:hypothetical protein
VHSTIDAAQSQQPGWVVPAFVCGLVCVAVTGIPVFFAGVNVSVARRLHWGGWLGAAAFFGVAASARGWNATVPVASLCLFLALLRAYFATPYLKIGGRVFSFFPQAEAGDSANAAVQRDQASYFGQVSAAKQWWLFALLCWIVGSAPFVTGWTKSLILPIAFLSFVAFIAGTDDSSRALPVARGQRGPAIVALIGLLPVFGIPVIGYLIGYQIGRKRLAKPGGQPPSRTST